MRTRSYMLIPRWTLKCVCYIELFMTFILFYFVELVKRPQHTYRYAVTLQTGNGQIPTSAPNAMRISPPNAQEVLNATKGLSIYLERKRHQKCQPIATNPQEANRFSAVTHCSYSSPPCSFDSFVQPDYPQALSAAEFASHQAGGRD
jgi:hypothetical protein